MYPLQWMGAVRMRVHTADKNIKIIHMLWKHGESNIIDIGSYTLLNDSFNVAFHFTRLTDGLELSKLLVDYCDVFISCLDSHSDGTHLQQRIHWWTSDVMLNFSKSLLLKKQTHLNLGSPIRWGHLQWIWILGWTIPLSAPLHIESNKQQPMPFSIWGAKFEWTA